MQHRNVGDIALDSISADGSNVTISSDVIVKTTPVTIGDGGAEDTMLVFDGNVADFKVLSMTGQTHWRLERICARDRCGHQDLRHHNLTMLLNSGVADGEYQDSVALFTAGEDLSAGEVVCFKSMGRFTKL